MPERDRLILEPEHPGREAFIERDHGLAGHRLQQPQLAARRHDRNRVQQLAGARLQSGRARQDHIADSRRHRTTPAGQRLGDEKRVPGRLRVEILRIDAARTRQLRDRLRREGLERQADDACRRRDVAEHNPQRMHPRQLVTAIRHHDQRAQPLDPPTKQKQ